MKRLRTYNDTDTEEIQKDTQAEASQMDEEKTETYKKVEEELLSQQTVLKEGKKRIKIQDK